jgi:uncharacterized protein (TIGR02145 family)
MQTIKLIIIAFIAFGLMSCEKDIDKVQEDADSGSFIDSRDGTTYNWVKIGPQKWMAENLAYLPEVSKSNHSSSHPVYYVYGYEGTSVEDAKKTSNYMSYGVLYNWAAANKACPAGWHLPATEEWSEIHHHVEGDWAYQSKSTTGWSNDGNGNNNTGLNIFPAGYRLASGNLSESAGFISQGEKAYFWSSSASHSAGKSRYQHFYHNSDASSSTGDKLNGLSVRCEKDL